MFSAIKFKLVAWFLGITSVVFVGLGVGLYHELKKIAFDAIDSHLHSEVQLIASLVKVDDGELEVSLDEVAVGDYALPLSGHYYQVLVDGEVVMRSPSLSSVGASLPVSGPSFEPVYRTITGPDRRPLRLNEHSFNLAGSVVTVQAAESLKDTYELLDSFRNIVMVLLPSVFVLSAVGGLLITRFSLRGLDVFARRVERVTERSLGERVDVEGVALELKPLAASFNTMLCRLEEFFERQRRFMSDASHQLRTPTAVIRGYCDVTLSRERSPEEYRKALESISDAAARMAFIIERILEVARLEDRIYNIESTDVDLMDVMKNVVKLFEGPAAQRSVRISLAGEHIKVRGDRDRLTEVFTNIVDNAIKYNRPGGSVDIEVRGVEGQACVTVADTGCGIPPNEREMIFDRFYRSEQTRTKVAGSGLGLSIVKGIVEAHGGRVEVESIIGKGSRFKVYLPMKREE